MRPPKASTAIEARTSSMITRVWPLRAHPLYSEFHFRIIKIILKSEKKLKIKAMLKFFWGLNFLGELERKSYGEGSAGSDSTCGLNRSLVQINNFFGH